MTKYLVSIVGASGYTGSELVRMLINHPNVTINQLIAGRAAGKEFTEVFAQFVGYDLPKVKSVDEASFEKGEIVFCALPHGTSQEVIASLPEYVKIIDLSADFRMQDITLYEEVYGLKHQAAHLQKEAVYGLSEVNRAAIKDSRLIACPGCYPTSIQLPLYPLLKNALIVPSNIIADSKSGTSGAGRGEKQAFLYCEVNEDFKPYAIASHRHAPEIEHNLKLLTGQDIALTFTPHLVPMMRGIVSTIYVELKAGVATKQLKEAMEEQYKDEPFVHLLKEGDIPSIRHVRGSNRCVMNIFEDRVQGRAIIVSAEDNLIKGASGQAIQNMNIILGLDEKNGLQAVPIYP
ncbi:MAG: N-acetyl-gamma-glutamyl-phosphate reductase [Alphaproteobacteria bacterium]